MSSLWIIFTGALVASSCGVLGCFLILRRMAMVGDAISHAILPGIVVAFLFTGSMNSVPMFLGAGLFGLLCTFFIQTLQQTGVQSDAAISIPFTSLFAIGVIFITLFTKQAHLDLECVLFGEIAHVPWDTLQFMGFNMDHNVYGMLAKDWLKEKGT